jgi:hypothetical protein
VGNVVCSACVRALCAVPADRAGAQVGFVTVAARWGWGWRGLLVVVGSSALVVGGSAGGITQDGVGGCGGGECRRIGMGMTIGVLCPDQPPVGVGDLRG